MTRLFGITKKERVSLNIQRNGKIRKVDLTPQVINKSKALELVRLRWGFELSDRKGGGGAEVTTVAPGSPAGKLGLQQGDIIHQIGNRRLASGVDLLNAFLRNRMQKTVLMRVQRGRGFYYVRLTL